MHFILSILHVGIGHIPFVTGLNNVPYKHVSRHVELLNAFLGYVIKQFKPCHSSDGQSLAYHWRCMGSVSGPGQSPEGVGCTKCSNSVTLLYIHKCASHKLYAAGDAGIS